MTDNNQHFKVRATSAAKGVFEVTPSESTILVKSLVDIAAMLKEIKEGQATTPKPLTQHANTSQQVPVKHCGVDFHAYAWTLNLVVKVEATPRLPGACLGVEVLALGLRDDDPRICVDFYAYAWIGRAGDHA
ncbi:hypothetical protein PIB30_095309 [Stylosanthes scabra]|uniref:Uncharacterized protein n=1 Tax=Stylosanthes scabra TaxID=79078 RepID=A0ABU6UV76_9FABA|nr:hypothetical protein [Stylosanthes scabra]